MDVMMPELELQHELQRFTSRFLDRITQSAETLQRSRRADVREEALRKNLLYTSAAMEIATGPSAAVNLLDMFVFLHLCRAVIERHWIPELYDEEGRELADAFTRSENELTEITHRALGETGHQQLVSIVDAWLADNPGQTRVEGMRLADFSAMAGSAAADRALQTRGLLSSMKVATEAANRALVIAERSMFLFHRIPFLWRLHVRLGARELVTDFVQRVTTSRGRRGVGYAALLGTAAMGMMWARSKRR